MEIKLKSVDISTAEELREIGSKEAYLRLKMQYPKVCRVYLYSLEGALTDTEYNRLPKETMKDLKEYDDSLITHI